MEHCGELQRAVNQPHLKKLASCREQLINQTKNLLLFECCFDDNEFISSETRGVEGTDGGEHCCRSASKEVVGDVEVGQPRLDGAVSRLEALLREGCHAEAVGFGVKELRVVIRHEVELDGQLDAKRGDVAEEEGELSLPIRRWVFIY